MRPTTVVFVHGAMHTPWVWSPVCELLRETHLDVALDAVQLPSSGEHSAECAGLIEDAAAVASAITRAPGRVVVVAHSYGGVPAAWASAVARSASGEVPSDLVRVAAFQLERDSSMLDWMGGTFPPGWRRSSDGLAVRVGDPAREIYSGVDPRLRDEAVKRLQWEGIRAFSDRVGATPGSAVRTTYIVAAADPSLPPAVQRQWADRSSSKVEVPSGHSPHLSHPTVIAGAIAQVLAEHPRDVAYR